MRLYFSPLACSLATRITLYEAGVEATFVEVDPRAKRTDDGRDYRTVHPLALVPVLETDEGERLYENAAILQYLAASHPAAKLAPVEGLAHARLTQWLSFIGAELHKALFVPLLDPAAPESVRTYALAKSPSRLGWLADELGTRPFLLDAFSVADAYLVAVLNWTAVVPVALSDYPALAAYHRRLLERPSVARAVSEERGLYAREQAALRAQAAR